MFFFLGTHFFMPFAELWQTCFKSAAWGGTLWWFKENGASAFGNLFLKPYRKLDGQKNSRRPFVGKIFLILSGRGKRQAKVYLINLPISLVFAGKLRRPEPKTP